MAEHGYNEAQLEEEHRQTWDGFMKLSKYFTIHVVVLLLLMAFFLL